MTDILVEVRGSWLEGKQAAFLDAVHRTVAQVLLTPADEPLVRLIEHAATNYLIPRSAGERFTRIEIALFAGQSVEAKRNLYQAMARNLRPYLRECGCHPGLRMPGSPRESAMPATHKE
jgi:hypothetical protein